MHLPKIIILDNNYNINKQNVLKLYKEIISLNGRNIYYVHLNFWLKTLILFNLFTHCKFSRYDIHYNSQTKIPNILCLYINSVSIV